MAVVGVVGGGRCAVQFGARRGHRGVTWADECSRALLEDVLHDVLIGSFCTIDRGSLTDTVIGEFTSIDNQVQIAHNVKIGNFCMIAAQSGIAGSTTIGNNVKIGGQTGISGHLSIGSNVNIGGKSGVIADIEDNQTVMGYPAKSIRDFLKDKK